LYGKILILFIGPKLPKKLLALKREHQALKNMKLVHLFSILWVIFAVLDPDPANQNQWGSMQIRIHNAAGNKKIVRRDGLLLSCPVSS
jgi:hypothetical protein